MTEHKNIKINFQPNDLSVFGIEIALLFLCLNRFIVLYHLCYYYNLLE
jgi:hypothetical protein